MAHHGGFSRATAICFTINYVVGTGFLTVPWAFHTGGIILSTLTMVIVTIICNTCKNYVLESMAIAEELVELHVVEDKEVVPITDETESITSTNDDEDSLDEESSILSFVRHDRSSSIDHTYGAIEEVIQHTTPMEVYAHNHEYEEVHQETEPGPTYYVDPSEQVSFNSNGSVLSRLIVKDRKFEITALCRLFLGDIGEKSYIVSIGLDIYGCLWGFTIVSASSLALAFPISKDFDMDYAIYTIAYAIIVIPLSCLELREQVFFQILYSICRFLVIIVMIVTSLIAVDDESKIYFTGNSQGEQTKMVKMEGFFPMFSILVFTAIFHAAIPVLSQPVADKRKLSGIFFDTFLVTGALFWLLGYAVTSYFGHNVEQSANLNWAEYVGGVSPDDLNQLRSIALWARTVSVFVVSFPAINVISSFPLNAIALGNNLMASVYGKAVHEKEQDRRLVIAFRLFSSLPPLVGALFVKDLGILTAWTGIVAIATAFPIPALLYMGSIKFANAHGLYKYETYYDGFGSSIAFARAVVVFSAFAMIAITMTLLSG